MNRTAQWISKRRNRIILALAINVLFLLLYLLLYSPAYEVNDDCGLNNIVSGVKGVRDPHMIYINYYAGVFIAQLYALAPAVAWTAILQYLILFSSFVVVTCILTRILQSPWFLPLIIGFLAIYEYEGYINLQYTKTAGIAAVAGLALIFSELFSERASRICLCLGLVLCWLGSMYRFQQFEATVAVFSVLVLYFLLSLTRIREQYDIVLKRRLLTAVVMAVLVVGGAFGLMALDKTQYTSDAWQEYTTYNEARTEATDFGIPPYDENEDKYLALGIDKSAYKLMKSWSFHDPEKFTTEVFESIASWRERPNVDGQFFKTFLHEFLSGLRAMEIFWVFLLIIFGWLICGRHGIREILTILFAAAVCLALYGYLFYVDRFLVHRVDVGIWFALSIMVLFLYSPQARRRGAIVGVLLLMLIAMCTMTIWGDHWRAHTSKEYTKMAKERTVIETLDADDEHLYLTKVGQISFFKAYGPFAQAPFGSGDNIFSLGGWTAATESYLSVLNRFDVTNPYREMINNDRIYLVDNDIDVTLDYLRAWYDSTAKAEEVKSVGRYHIYRIVSDPAKE